jgi:hypothetical protein
VLDETGAPVPEASVALMPDVGSPFGEHREAPAPERHQEPREGHTDGAGTCLIDGLVEGHYTVVAADTPDRHIEGASHVATQPVEVHAGSVPEVLVRFEPTLTVSGRVVDGRGQPIAGARVQAYPSKVADMASLARMVEHMPRAAESEADGSFVVKGLKAGAYHLSAMHSDYTVNRGGPSSVAAQAGDTGITLTLLSPAHVRGRVVHRDGSPVAAFELNGRKIEEATGAFDETFPAEGNQTLIFTAASLAPAHRQVTTKAGEDLTLPDVVLGAGRSVRVHAVSTAGSPVAGVHLGTGSPQALALEAATAGEAAGPATTGPDG